MMATRRDPSWRWLQPISVRVRREGWVDRVRPVVAVEDVPAAGVWALRLAVVDDAGSLRTVCLDECEVVPDAVGAWPAVVQLLQRMGRGRGPL